MFGAYEEREGKKERIEWRRKEGAEWLPLNICLWSKSPPLALAISSTHGPSCGRRLRHNICVLWDSASLCITLHHSASLCITLHHSALLCIRTRAQIKDPEKVTNKMYGGNTDIPSHCFRIFNLRPSINAPGGNYWRCTMLQLTTYPKSRLALGRSKQGFRRCYVLFVQSLLKTPF